jgi:hypothetical protein
MRIGLNQYHQNIQSSRHNIQNACTQANSEVHAYESGNHKASVNSSANTSKFGSITLNIKVHDINKVALHLEIAMYLY